MMVNRRLIGQLALLAMFFVLAYLLFEQLYSTWLSPSTRSGRPQTPAIDTAPWFTSEELDYVKYGEGNDVLVQPRDPRYLNFIRSQMARPNTNKPMLVKNTDQGHHTFIKNTFSGKTNGFFIECGANDGEFQSNTMWLENKMNWTGLLVEANPVLVRRLLSKNRNAFVYGGCLSPRSRPTTLRFKSAKCCGGLVDHLNPFMESLIQMYSKDDTSVDQVQCFPLNDLMAAIGVNHVDYMSLDVHGAEIPILKTINFRELRIDLITIECANNNETIRQEMANEIADLFNATGLYQKVGTGPGDLVVRRLDKTTAHP